LGTSLVKNWGLTINDIGYSVADIGFGMNAWNFETLHLNFGQGFVTLNN